jgi:hypothetical protein
MMGILLMTRHFHVAWIVLALFVLLPVDSVSSQQPTPANKDDLAQKVDKIAESLGNHSYRLAYKSTPGEELEYKVEHMVTVKTKVDGTTQRSQSRSVSGKKWNFSKVEPNALTFTHSVNYVDMWQETQGQIPVRYDSRTDKEVPPEYSVVAKMIGSPISTVTIDAAGKEINREDVVKQHDMGTGGIVLPLPVEAVALGAEWSVPDTAPIQLEDGSFKKINYRTVYELKKVQTGIATISIKSQILTPGIDARIHSKMIQKLSNGMAKFDIDNGRLLSKTLEWNEKVVGFNGASSQMEYVARMKEEYQSTRVASAK